MKNRFKELQGLEKRVKKIHSDSIVELDQDKIYKSNKKIYDDFVELNEEEIAGVKSTNTYQNNIVDALKDLNPPLKELDDAVSKSFGQLPSKYSFKWIKKKIKEWRYQKGDYSKKGAIIPIKDNEKTIKKSMREHCDSLIERWKDHETNISSQYQLATDLLKEITEYASDIKQGDPAYSYVNQYQDMLQHLDNRRTLTEQLGQDIAGAKINMQSILANLNLIK